MERAKKEKVTKEYRESISDLMNRMEFVVLDLVKKVEFQRGRLAERKDLLKIVEQNKCEAREGKKAMREWLRTKKGKGLLKIT